MVTLIKSVDSFSIFSLTACWQFYLSLARILDSFKLSYLYLLISLEFTSPQMRTSQFLLSLTVSNRRTTSIWSLELKLLLLITSVSRKLINIVSRELVFGRVSSFLYPFELIESMRVELIRVWSADYSTDKGIEPDVVLVGIGFELTHEVISARDLLKKSFGTLTFPSSIVFSLFCSLILPLLLQVTIWEYE